MSSSLQRRVEVLLKERGVYFRKIVGSAYQKNLPDTLACYKGFWIALEIKVGSDRLSEGQKYELRKIRKAGGIAEEVRSTEIVTDILDALDAGILWSPVTPL